LRRPTRFAGSLRFRPGADEDQDPPAAVLDGGAHPAEAAPGETADQETVSGSGPKCKILHTYLSNRIGGESPWRA
jgi:hypothetical protein